MTKYKLHHGRFSKANLVICALIFAGVGLYALFYTHAAGPVPVSTYVDLGTHPQAAAQATAEGKVIHYLAVYNNKIYAAYGDRINNTGPIAINPFNPATGQFDGVEFTDATEIIDVYRTIGGKLYANDGDPFGGNGGYSVGVPWSQRQPVSALHILDVASYTGTDLWLAGYDSASGKLWRSTDGGTTWSVALNDPSQVGYYWMASVGGKFVTQAFGGTNSRIFDGTTWTNGPDINFYISYPEMFKGKMISREMGLSSFDGTTLTYIPGFGTQDRICSTPPCSDAISMATDGSYFYVLKKDQTVVRTADLSTWDTVATSVPTTAVSMAVYNNYLYFGTTDSKLLRTATQLDTTITPPPSPTLTISTNPTTITNGSSSTLSWSSANATSCTASNGWSGAKAISGTQSVSPITTTTYTLTCTGTGGSANKSATVTVNSPSPPPPSPTPPPPSPTPTPPPPTPSPSPTPPPASKVGDLNHDGVVNIFDLSILLSKYGSSDQTADINTDHSVNIFDLSILLSKYGG